MSIRRFGGALVVSVAISLVLATSAFAKPETKVGGWVTGAILEVGKSESINCSDAQPLTFETEVGTTPLKFSISKVECPSGTIKEVENGGKMAEVAITPTFSGVTVTTPSTCAASVSSKALTGRIEMEGSTVYLRLAPTEGTTLATLTLTKGTGACALSGTYNVTGALYGRFNSTGVGAGSQSVVFSNAIEEAAGGEVKVGAKKAIVSGELKIALKAGGTFKVEETPTPPSKTVSGQWYVKGSKLTVGSSKSIKCVAAEAFAIRGLVLRVPIEIKATGIECLESTIKEVENTGIMAELAGQLKLTGVTVASPEGCKIASTLTLKPVASRVYMGGVLGTSVYTRYLQSETEPLGTVKLEGCTQAGSYPLEGDFYGQWNATGTNLEAQTATFSEAVQSTANGSLLLGGEVAEISGVSKMELGEGGAWAVEEK